MGILVAITLGRPLCAATFFIAGNKTACFTLLSATVAASQ
jgi:hypothetical protein